MRSSLVFVLAFFALACNEDNFLVDTAVASLPAEVRLQVGHSVYFPREGYAVTFEKVTADSRCPIGVECFWEGDGAAWLSIRDKAGTVANDTLHTTLDPKRTQLEKITIRLKSLEPYPVYNVPLDPTSYHVTLEVDRVAAEPLESK
jgi:hypothetical protein